MNKNIKIEFGIPIFDEFFLDLILEKIEEFYEEQYFDNEYCLIVNLNPNDLTDDCLRGFKYSYWRPWHDNYSFLENIELSFRLIISRIKECMEDCEFYIEQIFVKSDNQIGHTEIQLEKIGLHDFDNKKKRPGKIHLDFHLLNGKHILKIVDLIGYMEHGFYIDERNNNKNFYNSLLLKKELGEELKIEHLSEYDWKQLFLKEGVFNRELADLYDLLENDVAKRRKQFIPSIKQFDDEYLIYYVMFNSMSTSDYYSNFCIPLLEQMKSKKIKVIYEYLNRDYHELFYVEDELKRQKEIERNNLAGKKYIMPLSGVFLKKLYWAIKNHQLDRKFLKNNWFKTYYGEMFSEGFLKRIEDSHILELYYQFSYILFPCSNI